MTLETALNLLATMPGKPDWNDDIANLYALHLADWHPTIRQKAVMEATATCSFRPAVCDLREIALRHSTPLPSAAALREQITALILFHPPARRPHHASALLRSLADELGGWHEMGMLSTEEMDRRFPGAVQRARAEFLVQNAAKLLAADPSHQIQGVRP
jgi:hypothetical protein